jgi:hypothetical protein
MTMTAQEPSIMPRNQNVELDWLTIYTAPVLAMPRQKLSCLLLDEIVGPWVEHGTYKLTVLTGACPQPPTRMGAVLYGTSGNAFSWHLDEDDRPTDPQERRRLAKEIANALADAIVSANGV